MNKRIRKLGCDVCSGENDKPGWLGRFSDDGYIGYTSCWNCNPDGVLVSPSKVKPTKGK